MRWFKIFLFLSILVQTNNTLSAQNLAVKELDETIKEDTACKLAKRQPNICKTRLFISFRNAYVSTGRSRHTCFKHMELRSQTVFRFLRIVFIKLDC